MFEIQIVSRVIIVGIRADCVFPLLLNISIKYGQKRPFSTSLVYGSGVISQLLLPANSVHLPHSSNGNPRHSPLPLFLGSQITEVKESPLPPALVLTNHLQNFLLGFPFVGYSP